MEGNFLTGCKFGGRGKEEEEELVLSYLLFADGTLLFSKANPNQLAHLGWNLMWFEALLGLKINLGKSEIFPVGGSENVEALAAKLDCKVGTLPSMYLGLPLGPCISQLGCGILLRKDLGGDRLIGSRNIFLKGGDVTLI